MKKEYINMNVFDALQKRFAFLFQEFFFLPQGAFHGFQFPGGFMQSGTGGGKGGFQFLRGRKAGFLVNAHGRRHLL